MNYFAYGSNMCLAWLRSRVPSARPIGAANLHCHTLRWHKRSIDGSAKCNALSTGRAKDVVIGALFSVEPEEISFLDAAEGQGAGYMRTNVTVSGERETSNAFTYVAVNEAIDESLFPYDWYKALVVAGAHERGLPSDYIEGLEKKASIPDPDSPRAARAWRLMGRSGTA